MWNKKQNTKQHFHTKNIRMRNTKTRIFGLRVMSCFQKSYPSSKVLSLWFCLQFGFGSELGPSPFCCHNFRSLLIPLYYTYRFVQRNPEQVATQILQLSHNGAKNPINITSLTSLSWSFGEISIAIVAQKCTNTIRGTLHYYPQNFVKYTRIISRLYTMAWSQRDGIYPTNRMCQIKSRLQRQNWFQKYEHERLLCVSPTDQSPQAMRSTSVPAHMSHTI